MTVEAQSWTGGEHGDRGRCVLAPNPGIMTLDGTNTWVLREPGSARSIVVDPGPLHDEHLDAVAEVAGEVEAVVVTHHHLDHTEAARAFAERMGCGVRGLDPAQCWRSEPLADGEVLSVGGLDVEVITTPGHTTDSISLVVDADGALLTGDMVLGRGTTVIVHPDGDLGSYFDSIARMRSLVTSGRVRSLWPAHGPVLPDAAGVLDHYVVHRRERLAQVEQALQRLCLSPAQLPADVAEDPTLPRQVVEVVYADVDESLWGAAEWSVRAQLAYLARR
ncbi:MBL fold metallo-hydrolase [Nocardioides kongjuensis]|uniref:Glyoxylase-like metal-dependent hydrolase (Beta-lactamase superfamily II) n=1 Tax=Nocardioides kongjuensis TaxID=349522 RepID=A0A852RQU6_9ACTN|nr:MBL fold metallo-hydrolase [Nocardioides kongjuensis]NYD32928.1 glyoxylase-like metal-dependent hydrolase (beta-lactamase superfamily II) [Nocardioides kongjuensis]